MTGPEHYREAEMILGTLDDGPGDPAEDQFYLAKAQVHATLALTAATAMAVYDGGLDDGNRYPDWCKATEAKS